MTTAHQTQGKLFLSKMSCRFPLCRCLTHLSYRFQSESEANLVPRSSLSTRSLHIGLLHFRSFSPMKSAIPAGQIQVPGSPLSIHATRAYAEPVSILTELIGRNPQLLSRSFFAVSGATYAVFLHLHLFFSSILRISTFLRRHQSILLPRYFTY